jgi:hypothetical protein
VVGAAPVGQNVAGGCRAADLSVAGVDHELVGGECVGSLVLDCRGRDYGGQPESRPAPNYQPKVTMQKSLAQTLPGTGRDTSMIVKYQY